MTSAACKLNACRLLLLLCNTCYLVVGVGLVALSAQLLLDKEWVLLSRLLVLGQHHQRAFYPPFFYAALGLGCVGLAASSTAMLGCWSGCSNSKPLLATLIGVLAVVLVGEATLVMLASTLPAKKTLGVSLTAGVLEARQLIEVLQLEFGSPGHELFTAAFDLAQYKFGCCGVLGASDFEASWWRMQELGSREMRVPLTCCHLANAPDDQRAFLDPRPHNNTLCQAPNHADNKAHRFQKGCLQGLEQWWRTQWAWGGGVAGAVLLLQLGIFFSAVWACRCMPPRRPPPAS